MLLASDDIVFAWAIAKASLIVIASFGSLVYVAWAVTYQKESGTHLGIPNNHAYKSSVKSAQVPLITNGTIVRQQAGATRCGGVASVEKPRETVVVDNCLCNSL
jgi:hypothetical protein